MIVERTDVLVTVAAFAMVTPLAVVLLVAIGVWRRNRGRPVGRLLSGLLAVLGGAMFGLFILVSSGVLIVDFVFVLTVGALVYDRWRRGRRRQAGLLIAGFALPWTILWAFYVLAMTLGMPFEPLATLAGFLGGLAVVAVGAVIAARGDPPAPLPDPVATPGEPGARAIGSIAVAIFEPSRIGPFRSPDVAAVVGLVASLIVAGLLIPDPLLGVVAGAVIGAVVATEAFIRALPTRSRLAFEAFSWLGEWELERFKALTGVAAPSSPKGAEKWLAQFPESPPTNFARAELLVFADRLDEALDVAQRLPADTPWERLERATTLELVDWVRGGDGNLEAVEAALADLQPADSEEHLRGEVTIATARVRQAMAAGPPPEGDRLQPFIDVRERLGARANGQVGRALRKRMIPALLVLGALFGFFNLVVLPLLLA